MRQLRRLISGILLIALLVCLAGCEKNGKGVFDMDGPEVVELWTYYNGAAKTKLDELAAEFNDTVGNEKEILVNVKSSGDMNVLFDQLNDELAKPEDERELPDIFLCYASTALEFEQKGMLVNLDDYFTEEELSEYVDAYIEEGRVGKDQGLFLFPVAKSTEVMTVNKSDWDKFALATGSDIGELKTWEGLSAAAKKYYEWTDSQTDAPNDGRALFGRDAVANYMLAGLHQLGSSLFAVEDGKAKVTLDEKVLRKIWDYYYVPYISGYYTSKGRYRSDDMKTGELIAAVGSSSGGAYYAQEVTIGEEEPYPIVTDVLPVPNFDSDKPVVTQQGAGMAVTKSDKSSQEAAVTFLKWFTDAKINSEFSVVSAYLPVKKKANKIEFMEEVREEEQIEWSDTVRRTVEVSLDECNNYELYTQAPFEGSSECRRVIEKALEDKAVFDREKIAEQLTSGTNSLDELVGQMNTEENFEAWAKDLKAQLEAIIE